MSKNSQWLKAMIAIYAEMDNTLSALLESQDPDFMDWFNSKLSTGALPVDIAFASASFLKDKRPDVYSRYLQLMESMPREYENLYSKQKAIGAEKSAGNVRLASSMDDMICKMQSDGACLVGAAEDFFRADSGVNHNPHQKLNDTLLRLNTEIKYPNYLTSLYKVHHDKIEALKTLYIKRREHSESDPWLKEVTEASMTIFSELERALNENVLPFNDEMKRFNPALYQQVQAILAAGGKLSANEGIDLTFYMHQLLQLRFNPALSDQCAKLLASIPAEYEALYPAAGRDFYKLQQLHKKENLSAQQAITFDLWARTEANDAAFDALHTYANEEQTQKMFAWQSLDSTTWQSEALTEVWQVNDLLALGKAFDFQTKIMDFFTNEQAWSVWEKPHWQDAANPLLEKNKLVLLDPAIWPRTSLNNIARTQDILTLLLDQTADHITQQTVVDNLNNLTHFEATALIANMTHVNQQFILLKETLQDRGGDSLIDVVSITWGIENYKKNMLLAALQQPLTNEFKPQEIVSTLNFLISLRAGIHETGIEIEGANTVITTLEKNLMAYIFANAADQVLLNSFPLQSWTELSTLLQTIPSFTDHVLTQTLPTQQDLYHQVLLNEASLHSFLTAFEGEGQSVQSRLVQLQEDCDDPVIKAWCREKLANYLIAALTPGADSALSVIFADLKNVNPILEGMNARELEQILTLLCADENLFTQFIHNRAGNNLEQIIAKYADKSLELQFEHLQSKLLTVFVTEFDRSSIPVAGEKDTAKLIAMARKFFSSSYERLLLPKPLTQESQQLIQKALVEIFRSPQSLTDFLAIAPGSDGGSNARESLKDLAQCCSSDPTLKFMLQGYLYSYVTDAKALVANPDLNAFFANEGTQRALVNSLLIPKLAVLLALSQTEDLASRQTVLMEASESITEKWQTFNHKDFMALNELLTLLTTDPQYRDIKDSISTFLQDTYAFAKNTLEQADELHLSQSQRENLILLLLTARDCLVQQEQVAAASASVFTKISGKLSRSSSQSLAPDLKDMMALIDAHTQTTTGVFTFANSHLNAALVAALKLTSLTIPADVSFDTFDALLTAIIDGLNAEDFQVRYNARYQLMTLLTMGPKTVLCEGHLYNVQAFILPKLVNGDFDQVLIDALFEQCSFDKYARDLVLKELVSENTNPLTVKMSAGLLRLLAVAYNELLDVYQENNRTGIFTGDIPSLEEYRDYTDSVFQYLLTGDNYSLSAENKDSTSVAFFNAFFDALARLTPLALTKEVKDTFVHEHLNRLSKQSPAFVTLIKECGLAKPSMPALLRRDVCKNIFSDNALYGRFSALPEATKMTFFINAFTLLSTQGTSAEKAAGIQLFHTRFDATDLLEPLLQVNIDANTKSLMPAFFSKTENIDLFIGKLAKATAAERITTLLHVSEALGINSLKVIALYNEEFQSDEGIYGLLAEGFKENSPNADKLLNAILLIDIDRYEFCAPLFAQGNDQKEPFKTVIDSFLKNFKSEFEEEKARYRAQVEAQSEPNLIIEPPVAVFSARLTPLGLQNNEHIEYYQRTFLDEAKNLTGNDIFLGLRGGCERLSIFSGGEKVYNAEASNCIFKPVAIYDALNAATKIAMPVRNLALALCGTNVFIKNEAEVYLGRQLMSVTKAADSEDVKYGKEAIGEKLTFSPDGSQFVSEVTFKFYEEENRDKKGILGIKGVLKISLLEDGNFDSHFENSLEIYDIEKGFILLADMRSVQGSHPSEIAHDLKNLDYFNYPLLYTEIQTALFDALHQDLSVGEAPSPASVSAMLSAIFFNADSLRDFLANHEHDATRYPDGKLAWVLHCCGDDAALQQQLTTAISECEAKDKTAFEAIVDDLLKQAFKSDHALTQLAAPLFSPNVTGMHLLACNILAKVAAPHLWRLIAAAGQQETPLPASLEQLRAVVLQRPSILNEVLLLDAEDTDPTLRTACLTFLLNAPAIDNRFVRMPLAAATDGESASAMDYLVRSQMVTNRDSVVAFIETIFKDNATLEAFLDSGAELDTHSKKDRMEELFSWCKLDPELTLFLTNKMPSLLYDLAKSSNSGNSRMSMNAAQFTATFSNESSQHFIQSELFNAANIRLIIHVLAFWQKKSADYATELTDLRAAIFARPNLLADVLSLPQGGEQQQVLLRFLLEDPSIVSHATVTNDGTVIETIADLNSSEDGLYNAANKAAIQQLLQAAFSDVAAVEAFFTSDAYGASAIAKLKVLYQLCGEDAELKDYFKHRLLYSCETALADLSADDKKFTNRAVGVALLTPAVLDFVKTTLLTNDEQQKWHEAAAACVAKTPAALTTFLSVEADPTIKPLKRIEHLLDWSVGNHKIHWDVLQAVRTHVASHHDQGALQTREFKALMARRVLPSAAFGLPVVKDHHTTSARVKTARVAVAENSAQLIDTAWSNLHKQATKEVNAYWWQWMSSDRRSAINALCRDVKALGVSSQSSAEKMQALLALITAASQAAASNDASVNESRVGSLFSSFRNVAGSRFQTMLESIRLHALPTMAAIQKYEPLQVVSQEPLLNAARQVDYLKEQVSVLLKHIAWIPSLDTNASLSELKEQLHAFVNAPADENPGDLTPLSAALKTLRQDHFIAKNGRLSDNERSVGDLLTHVLKSFVTFNEFVAPPLPTNMVEPAVELVVEPTKEPVAVPQVFTTAATDEMVLEGPLDSRYQRVPSLTGRDSRSGSDSSLSSMNSSTTNSVAVEHVNESDALLTGNHLPSTASFPRVVSGVSITSAHSTNSSTGSNYSLVGVGDMRQETTGEMPPSPVVAKGDKWPLPVIDSELTSEAVEGIHDLRKGGYGAVKTHDY